MNPAEGFRALARQSLRAEARSTVWLVTPSTRPRPTTAEVATALAALASDHAVAAASLDDLAGLGNPGLYSWRVDPQGAAELSVGLQETIPEGLIYAGQTGATKWPSGKRGGATLQSRLGSQHVRGRIRGSTFRLTLAAVLRPALGLEKIDATKLASESEARLTEWILDHLAVAAHPYPNADALGELEDRVLTELDPPLNLEGRPQTRVRSRLSELRFALSTSAATTPRGERQKPRRERRRKATMPQASDQPKLHEEIAEILRESSKTWMTTSEIAAEVNRRDRYRKRDGSAVTPFQVHGRTRNYPELFVRDGSRVRLK